MKDLLLLGVYTKEEFGAGFFLDVLVFLQKKKKDCDRGCEA